MKLFSSVALFASLTLGSLAYGQDPAQRTPPPQKQSDAAKVSVTGCLIKGTSAGEYTVTDVKTGEKVPFAGPATLDKYLNQTVRLTGTMAAQGSDKVFKPEAINQVAPTCEKAQ
jgi:hypothetical protein